MQFTEAEKIHIVELVRENLKYFDEDLREEKSMEAAMAKFDKEVGVKILVKIDPEGAAAFRSEVEELLEEWVVAENSKI